jgi:hypothetical protein
MHFSQSNLNNDDAGNVVVKVKHGPVVHKKLAKNTKYQRMKR